MTMGRCLKKICKSNRWISSRVDNSRSVKRQSLRRPVLVKNELKTLAKFTDRRADGPSHVRDNLDELLANG